MVRLFRKYLIQGLTDSEEIILQKESAVRQKVGEQFFLNPLKSLFELCFQTKNGKQNQKR